MTNYEVRQTLYNKEGVAVSGQYDCIEYIGEIYYKVTKRIDGNSMYNIINNNGRELSEEWFKEMGEFNEGRAIVVCNNGKYNLISIYAKKLLVHSRDFDLFEYKGDGLYLVRDKKGRYNLIGKSNKLLRETWFYKITNISKQGAIVVQKRKVKDDLEDKQSEYYYNYISADGKMLLIKSCPKIEVYDGYVRAYFNDYTDRHYNGNVLWQRIVRIRDGRVTAEGRFLDICDIESGYKVIKKEGKNNQYNILDPNYQLIFDEWYDDVSVFFYGCNNKNVFFAAGNKVGERIRFKIYDENKTDIFEKYFDTLYPLNTKKGEYVFIKGEKQYKAYMMRKIISEI